MPIVDGRKKSSGDNLAKARQAKLDKLNKQKELDKYIIYDSDEEEFVDEEEEWSDEPDDEPMPKRKKSSVKTATKKGTPTKAVIKRAAKKQLEKQQKAELLMKEIEELKNNFRKLQSEPVKIAIPDPVPAPAPVPAPTLVPAPEPIIEKPVPVQPKIQASDIYKNKLINF